MLRVSHLLYCSVFAWDPLNSGKWEKKSQSKSRASRNLICDRNQPVSADMSTWSANEPNMFLFCSHINISLCEHALVQELEQNGRVISLSCQSIHMWMCRRCHVIATAMLGNFNCFIAHALAEEYSYAADLSGREIVAIIMLFSANKNCSFWITSNLIRFSCHCHFSQLSLFPNERVFTAREVNHHSRFIVPFSRRFQTQCGAVMSHSEQLPYFCK